MLERYEAGVAYVDFSEEETGVNTEPAEVKLPPAKYFALEQRKTRHVFYVEMTINGGDRRYPVKAGELLMLPRECYDTKWSAKFYTEHQGDAPVLRSESQAASRVGFIVADCVFSPSAPMPSEFSYTGNGSSTPGTKLCGVPSIFAKSAKLDVTSEYTYARVSCFAVDQLMMNAGSSKQSYSGFSDYSVNDCPQFSRVESDSLDCRLSGVNGTDIAEPSFTVIVYPWSSCPIQSSRITFSTTGAVSLISGGPSIATKNRRYASLVVSNPSGSAGSVSAYVQAIFDQAKGEEGFSTLTVGSLGVAPGVVNRALVDVSGAHAVWVRMSVDGAIDKATVSLEEVVS